jgi:hypothetical protein
VVQAILATPTPHQAWLFVTAFFWLFLLASSAKPFNHLALPLP